MASKPITLKVSNKSRKGGIKKLPESISIDATTTVEQLKASIAKASDGRDPNRIGLFDPDKKKILKDRKAVVSQLPLVMGGKEVLVKDLGPQISWQTVFIIEYAGPIFIHLAFLLLRPYIYSGVSKNSAMSYDQILSLVMIVVHFIKREYETIFVHRFSNATMPFTNVFKNSGHYWGLSGVNLAYWVYSPYSYAASPPTTLSKAATSIGAFLYIWGELSNLHTHMKLSSLRTPGTTERGIPTGYGFDLVTCPNYLFETIAWVGICLVSKSLSTVLFTVVAFAQMQQWAWQKEKAYRTEFGDKYKKKRSPIIPTLGMLMKALSG